MRFRMDGKIITVTPARTHTHTRRDDWLLTGDGGMSDCSGLAERLEIMG